MIDTEPRKEFRDDGELNSCLREWQRILYLEDWVIKAKLVDREELITEDGDELIGRNTFIIESKCALIRVAKPDDDLRGRVIKYCAELILVHELLHCKRNWLKPPNSLEGAFYDTLQHQALEEEARSYLLARYNITKEWFSNIG